MSRPHAKVSNDVVKLVRYERKGPVRLEGRLAAVYVVAPSGGPGSGTAYDTEGQNGTS